MTEKPKPTEHVVIEGVRDVAKTAVGGALTEKVALGFIAAVVVMYLGWLWSLPPDRREPHGPLELINAILGVLASSWLTWLPWVLFVLAVAIGGLVIRTLWRRNQQQGRELAKHRKNEDPDRRSSRGADVAHMMDEVLALPPKAAGEQLGLDLKAPSTMKSPQPSKSKPTKAPRET